MGGAEIRAELLSDASFGSGEGTPGEVDLEVEHDDLGLPYLPGKRIRGLLRDSWLEMAHAFRADAPLVAELLGVAGDVDLAGTGRLDLRDATLPSGVRRWVEWAVLRPANPVSPRAVLRALTVIRHQTARDRRSGAPMAGTLRESRAVMRGLSFYAPVTGTGLTEAHWHVLARLCRATRHAGQARNRGRGHIRLHLLRDDAGASALPPAAAPHGAAP
jgi:hypothetical protein